LWSEGPAGPTCRGAAALDAALPPPYSPPARSPRKTCGAPLLNLLKSIFTWWNGATIGVRFHVGRRGRFVGEDATGNRYYEARDDSDSFDKGLKRRWVIFNGYAEASKVPAEWHGWLHHTFEDPPTVTPLPQKAWEKEHLPNLSGTIYAYRPQGSLARGGERQVATGDYEAWKP
jgi:NADH:ubiquinone oxidoreductase subunit